MTTLPERMRTLRELSGLSARDISERAGLAATHFALIEDGKRKEPSAETLASIARVLGVDLNWLVTGEGMKPTKESVAMALAHGPQRVSNGE